MMSKEFQIGLLHKCLDLDFLLCDTTELSKFFYGMFSPFFELCHGWGDLCYTFRSAQSNLAKLSSLKLKHLSKSLNADPCALKRGD